METFPTTTQHNMRPPYSDMDGAMIELLFETKTDIGEIIVSDDRTGKRFGMRIEVRSETLRPTDFGFEYLVTSFDVSEAGIRSISEINRPDARFQMKVTGDSFCRRRR